MVDVGCATHGADRSIEPLIERFKPGTLYGFDPQVFTSEMEVDGTRVVLDSRAAWVYDGSIAFGGAGLGARVGGESGQVPCIDLARWLGGYPGAVLKLDAEGAEFPLLERILDTGVDERLRLVLVEWHCPECHHGIWRHAPTCETLDEAEALALEIEERLRCPVERWEL